MELHHGKHHAAYVDKLNAALDKYPELFEPSIEELMLNLPSIPEDIRTDVHNHGGGHANHAFFWPLLGKDKGGQPVGELKKAIGKSFGSFENFKEQFHAVSLKHFGSGWAWLSAGRFGNLLVHCSPNQHNPLMLGLIPVVGLDVWEHADQKTCSLVIGCAVHPDTIFAIPVDNRRIGHLHGVAPVLACENATNRQRFTTAIEYDGNDMAHSCTSFPEHMDAR